MSFFNFHHHNPNVVLGIYNMCIGDTIPKSFFSVGLHPADIDGDFEIKFEEVKEFSKNPNCFAIGECGLDGLVDVDEKLQEEIFEKQILWANEIKKPLIIHCVRRFSKLLHFKKMAKVPMVVHGFHKKESIAKDLLKHDFYLSFGKPLLDNVSLQQTVKDFPLQKLFLETDVENFEISKLYRMVANIKNLDLKSVENQILNNLETIRNG